MQGSPPAPGQSRARRYLAAARGAGRWVSGARILAPDGPAWPVQAGAADQADATLYGAGAGVALFLASLAAATGDADTTAAARAAARFVARTPDGGRFGLYTGYSGMALAVDQAGLLLGDDGLRGQAARMMDRVASAARPAGVGVQWPPMPSGRGPWQELYHGTAGIALVAARLGRLDLAVSAGRRLAGLSQPAATGRWWRSRPDDMRPAPNIAHGTAGISYALATLALDAGEPAFAAAALDGAAYLLSIARTTDGTCAVHHHEGDGTGLYTLGWCSGPPGLGGLFVRLHQLTGDQSWLEWAARAARTVTASGLPQRRYPGFWDNVAQCCGSAGVADFFLGLHLVTGDPAHLDFACIVLDDIVDRAVTDDQGTRWHNIEHTATPPELPAQTGWMQGAAGIGAALLRGHQVLSGRDAGPWLPSWPFPGRPGQG
jgi:lantibiotic modifying enzyme